MRRLQLLGPPFRARGRRGWLRCVLTLEELLARDLLAPVVSPGFIIEQTDENTPYDFSGVNQSAFQAADGADSGQTYTAQLTATNGTLAVDPTVAAANGVAVAGNGTAAVTLTGTLSGIDLVLIDGLTYTPAAYFSGEASVNVTVTDTTNGASDTGTGLVRVQPVVSNATFSVASSGEVWAPASGFAFPPGFVSATNWPDADGSETFTVFLSLDAPDPAAFTLSAGGVTLAPVEDGFWRVIANSQAELRSMLDALVLTPPAGFTGRVSLDIFANIYDQATFPSSEGATVTDSRAYDGGIVAVRFFQGGTVSLPALSGREGGTIDLGGRYAAADPDELDGDVHTLTLTAPSGTLRLNGAAVPAGLSASRAVAPDGSTTVTLTGTVAAINQFLATPGCMTYTAADLTFSGVVPLTVVLSNRPAPYTPSEPRTYGQPADRTGAPGTFTGTALLQFAPVADHVIPSALNAVTRQDTPVALAISLTALADMDGSESVLVVLGDVPAGAAFSAGTDLGGGQWAFSAADLVGLTFTPPAGATGTYALTVKVVVTDSAPGVGTDGATDSTAFTVTVLPNDAPAPTPTTPSNLLPPAADDGEPAFDPGPEDVLRTDAGGEVEGREPHDDGADRGDEGRGPERVPFAGYTGGPAPAPPTLAAQAGRDGPQGPGTAPFPPSEAPAPLYAGGERHPLPPVLPLDQTLPVAGFSDSGGDSFALIDMIYRGAAANPAPAAFVTPVAHAAPADTIDAPVPHWKEPLAALVAAVPPAGDSGGGTPAEEPAGEGAWRIWAAAGAGACGAVAAMRVAGGPNWLAGRLARRLLSALHRRHTEGTA